MNRLPIAAATVAFAVSVGPAVMAAHHEEAEESMEAVVIDAAGKEIGSVSLEQTPNGVLITASVDDLPAGEHGFHIHETGICDPAEGFKTAGGHYAPRKNAHGLREVAGHHAGDMPNQYADDHGQLRVQVMNVAVTLGPGFNSLMDADGSALVIHEGVDDYTSQPSGAAGNRLACAVLAAPKSAE